MPYRYDYGSLVKADSTKANNFKPLSEVAGTQDFGNQAIALLQAKGITSAADTNSFINAAANNAGGSTIKAMQNIANLTEAQTAVARGDTWGGSDDTMGRSWLEGIVSGTTDATNIGVEDLYQQGFGRASDAGGLAHWTSDMEKGSTIQDIARHFLASEESNIRDVYHEEYGRDADAAGLEYWRSATEGDDSEAVRRAIQYRGDNAAWVQKETSVRDRLSSELGLHSTDAQRLADTSLHGADGIAGTDDDIFTDASEADVNRMMASGDLGAQEIADKVRMQTAASAMGDYGGGVDDVGATGIHRMLAEHEMGTPVTSNNIDDGTFGKEQWVSDPTRLAMTSADYLPTITKNYDEDGNLISTDESNVWSLLRAGTQNYGIEDINKPKIEEEDDQPPGGEDDDDGIVVTSEDVDYTPPLHSDVEDKSTYGASKDAFDNAAAGIDAPLQDMMIRNADAGSVGGSAEGVRLKRSKKFKSGEAALGTKQLGRQLQIKSLNI